MRASHPENSMACSASLLLTTTVLGVLAEPTVEKVAPSLISTNCFPFLSPAED